MATGGRLSFNLTVSEQNMLKRVLGAYLEASVPLICVYFDKNNQFSFFVSNRDTIALDNVRLIEQVSLKSFESCYKCDVKDAQSFLQTLFDSMFGYEIIP